MELEPIPCLFCPQSSDQELFPARLSHQTFTPYAFSARRERQIEHYRIVRCRHCGLVRSTPVLNEAAMDALYGDSEYLYAEETPHAARTYRDLLTKLLTQHAFRVESLLEVGCGPGFFLEQAMEMGIGQVLGFEPSRACVDQAAPALRSHIVNAPFDPQALGGRCFDLAVSFHVFDHVRDPLKVLRSMVAHLNPGGCVLLVCHDVESLGARVLGDWNPIFDVEHIYLFTPSTMARLFQAAGLHPLHLGPLTNRYPLQYWLRLFPGGTKLFNRLPKFIGNRMLSLRAGNFFAFGVKPGDLSC